MAGCIFGLPLSQRVDANGKPASGWLCYYYVQNTSTPVDSYVDTALTIKNSWPVQADASGMIGPMWLVDGSYRVRATSADGSVVFFDLPSVLAIGASAGAAPSGGVDPNAIHQTGDIMWLDVNATRAGWVRDNGRTIGGATSSATERPHADTKPLFQWLYANFSNTLCPVSGGRTGNSSDDFDNNKTIQLLDKRGVGIVGADDMGNSNAGYLSGSAAPFWIGNSMAQYGTSLGEIRHVINQAELPNVNLAVSIPASTFTHSHNYRRSDTGTNITIGEFGNAANGGSGGNASSGFQSTRTQDSLTGAFSGNWAALGGSGQGHNIIQPVAFGTWYRKL